MEFPDYCDLLIVFALFVLLHFRSFAKLEIIESETPVNMYCICYTVVEPGVKLHPRAHTSGHMKKFGRGLLCLSLTHTFDS